MTSPPPPPDPFNYQAPEYLDPKFASSPIQIEGGPSAEYQQANDDWARQMGDMYDRGLAEYFWSKDDRDAVQQILARNPNVGIQYNRVGFHSPSVSGSVFGMEAAKVLNALGTLLDEGIFDQVGGPGFSGRQGFAHAPQNTRKIDLQKQITLLTGSFDSEDEAKVRNAVEHLLSEKCDDAFQAAGLATPASIISKSGIVLGAATLLMNSANNSSSGITEYARRRDLNAVGSTGIQAFTIRNHPGKTPDTTDERARIFLNRSAFSGGLYSLQDVITHEFMHVAGMEAANVPIYGPLIRRHDLSYVKNYESIIEACK